MAEQQQTKTWAEDVPQPSPAVPEPSPIASDPLPTSSYIAPTVQDASPIAPDGSVVLPDVPSTSDLSLILPDVPSTLPGSSEHLDYTDKIKAEVHKTLTEENIKGYIEHLISRYHESKKAAQSDFEKDKLFAEQAYKADNERNEITHEQGMQHLEDHFKKAMDQMDKHYHSLFSDFSQMVFSPSLEKILGTEIFKNLTNAKKSGEGVFGKDTPKALQMSEKALGKRKAEHMPESSEKVKKTVRFVEEEEEGEPSSSSNEMKEMVQTFLDSRDDLSKKGIPTQIEYTKKVPVTSSTTNKSSWDRQYGVHWQEDVFGHPHNFNFQNCTFSNTTGMFNTALYGVPHTYSGRSARPLTYQGHFVGGRYIGGRYFPDPPSKGRPSPFPTSEDTDNLEPASEDTDNPEPVSEDTNNPEPASEDTNNPEPSPDETDSLDPTFGVKYKTGPIVEKGSSSKRVFQTTLQD